MSSNNDPSCSGAKSPRDEYGFTPTISSFTMEELNLQDDDNSEDDISESGSVEVIEEVSTEPDFDEFEDEEDLLEVYNNVPKIQFGEIAADDGLTCVCKNFEDIYSCISYLESMVDLTPNFDNHSCMIDNLIRAFNYIFTNINKSIHYSKVAFTDYFYRIRHEVLFKLLCSTLNLPASHSDVPFSNFGIDSNRTPDLIVEVNEMLIIIEVTATSGLEKAAMSKGMESLGFESKYQSEIEQLESLGLTVSYHPIFFDMSNTSSPMNTELFLSLSKHFKVSNPFKILLQAVSKEFSILTSNLKYHLVLSSAVLFSKPLPIEPNHPNYSFLYNKVHTLPDLPYYEEKTISMPVYSKVSNDKERLFWLLDNNNFTDLTKVIFVLNNVGHRVTLEQNFEYGATLNELRDLLINSDIVTLMKHVKLKMGNVLIDTTDSETGVKFFERKFGKHYKNFRRFEALPLIQNHTTQDFKSHFDFTIFKTKVKQFLSQNLISKHFDANYENDLINMITKMDMDDTYNNMPVNNLLGDLLSENIDIDDVMLNIERSYVLANIEREEIPVVHLKMKPPFLLPLADLNNSSYSPLDFKNTEFIQCLINESYSRNPYTSLILQNVLMPSYKMYTKSKPASSVLLNLISQRSKISNEINSLQKKLYRDQAVTSTKISNESNEAYRNPFLKLRQDFKNIQKEIRLKKRIERVGEEISFIRLPTKNKKSNLRMLYDQEMVHFKDKKMQSTIEGVGIRSSLEEDYNFDIDIFYKINSLFSENRGPNPDGILHDYVADDVCLLKGLKEISLERFRGLMNEILNSSLGHSTAFVSRLAHSLMFYSQLSFNSDYIRVDNLGYKNCLLIVRGGKKIFKSKSSKLFRLIYPISEVITPWYQQGHRDKGSFQFFEYNGTQYAITPWAMFHESVLTDAISFHSRVMSFTLLNLNPKIGMRQQIDKISLNIILAFHNRRKTEVMLANMRYILLSTLGDFTGITQILPEFFDFNYDCFQSFIRSSILYNYPHYFKQLQELKREKGEKNKVINTSDYVNIGLKNIFTGKVLAKVEDLTLMIYSTFLMTKAPYQKIAERAKNLSGILSIHEQYDREVGLKKNPKEQLDKVSVVYKGDVDAYLKNLFNSDFNIDPKFNACIGNFIDSYYMNLGCQDELETSWLNIMNESWDELSTSTGLRGDYDTVEDFWGQKGYFVVYKHLLNESDYVSRMSKLFSVDLTHDEKRKLLRGLNEVYVEKMSPDREFLIFHAVDKVQWRGSREIYVMDMMTKTMQQPIEKFMAVLCKKLDNELISIPSDRRSQVIHHAIFDRELPLKEMLTWYLTLDCSKWAPKSIFVKFAIVLLNMFSIPNSFKVHFLNYLEKLHKKRIYFNNSEVEALQNNEKYKEVCSKFLIKDNKVNGYYLEMPYSWVMGIFNYTSSFLHAANQKYASYILMKTSMLNFREETSLVMFAHSDDSGGRLNVSSFFMAKRGIILYEILLKMCNHLLSKKKSVISRIYFEILSIIYMFKKLLALLPKFLGGIRFLPSDKGPAQDMLQSYSKGIEVLTAGADFCTSYIVMKIYSNLIWRFYYNRQPEAIDYKRPVQYLGLPDAHPLMFLLTGSDSDILRLIKNNEHLEDLMTFINTVSLTADQDGPIKSLKFEIKVKGIKKGFEELIDFFRPQLESWSIRNVNYHNTPMNALNFLRKLNDSGFVGSLVNESTTRRISRAYFLRSGESCMTRLGNIKLGSILDSIVLFQKYKNKDDSINHILKEVLEDSQINEIEKEFSSNIKLSERSIKLMVNTLRSPLKILKYMDMLSMDGRKINPMPRTLKPTHIQLTKSSKVFSRNFDPASLVSYLKEPEWRWALQSIKNLNISALEAKKFCENAGFDIEEIEPDLLLRLCRTYGKENTKSVYLYSRIPGDIRQIKTYTGFLTFLSVNSFQNEEVLGLTLKLSDKDLSKEYVQTNLLEEVYLVNNILSLMVTLVPKLSREFITNIFIKEISEIEWEGGSFLNLVNHIEKISDTDVRYNIILPILVFLKNMLGLSNLNADELNKQAYYTFLKSQKSRSGWVGKGEVYIRIESNFYSMVINNSTIEEVYTNKTGKIPEHHSDFIIDVLNNINVRVDGMKRPLYKNFNKLSFGYDGTGNLSILNGREIDTGVPCSLLTCRNDFVDQLENYEMVSLSNDTLLIKSGYEGVYVYKKLHLLPIKKAELLNTIKMVFDPRDFEEKMMEFGVNDFEDFIYTEILTEYGKEIYIDFSDLFDNYLGSKLYDIFKKTFEKNISKINKAFNFSPLPASEGSMIRILIDYSRETGDIVVKTPTALTPTMMQIRSEYPEQMTTLLGHKMKEYHDQIFTNEEIKEISDNYSTLSCSDNLEEVRNSVIKLMTYWGYGSLVHSIQNFTLVREPKNYLFFNLNVCKSNLDNFSSLFVTITNTLLKVVKNWRPYFKSLEVYSKQLLLKTNLDKILENYLYYVVMGVYGFRTALLRPSLYQCQFLNILYGLLQEDDFNSELQEALKSNYVLGSIPISFKYRYEICALLNNLHSCWLNIHKTDFELNYRQKLQRLPDNTPHFRSLLNQFEIESNNVANAYYHGFINDGILSKILNQGEVVGEDRTYRVSNRVVRPSGVSIVLNDVLQFKRPLSEAALEHDVIEDLFYELTMTEIDSDEVLNLWSEIDEKYKAKTTKTMKVKNRTIVRGVLNWLIEPNCAHRSTCLNNIRQVGENIAIISDTLNINLSSYLPNSGVRIINPKKDWGIEGRPFLVYYTLQKDLFHQDYIKGAIGGVEYDFSQIDYNLLRPDLIRDINGELVESKNQGFVLNEEMLEGDKIVEIGDGVLIIKNKEDSDKEEQMNTGTEEPCLSDLEKKYVEISHKLDLLKDSRSLDESSVNHLKQKYLVKSMRDGLSKNIIMNSMVREADLISINNEILSNTAGVSAENQKRMFLSPEYFSLNHGVNKTDVKSIKDKKVRSELNAFYPGLAESIGSNTLKLSFNFQKIILANFKMWNRMVNFGGFKKENKKFLLSTFIALCNNTLISEDEDDDHKWQSIVNKMTVYISDEGPESEDMENELSGLLFTLNPMSRLRYRAEGT